MSVLLALVIATASARPAPETPVRASFGDGQILMGEVRTETLVLTTGAGVVSIPLDDVGEVVPADGEGLAEARGRVTVWLRNGSELRGTWTNPTLEMRVNAGGERVSVDLPLADLNRFQLQGRSEWTNGPVYRLRTAFGDDVLVDPAKTTVTVNNAFGSFSPRLSECDRIAPVDEPDGPWRVELTSGTVLIGELADSSLTVALPMGPESVSVALADVVALDTGVWMQQQAVGQAYGAPAQHRDLHVAEVVSTRRGGGRRRSQAASAAPAPADQWFDRSVMEASKVDPQ